MGQKRIILSLKTLLQTMAATSHKHRSSYTMPLERLLTIMFKVGWAGRFIPLPPDHEPNPSVSWHALLHAALHTSLCHYVSEASASPRAELRASGVASASAFSTKAADCVRVCTLQPLHNLGLDTLFRSLSPPHTCDLVVLDSNTT